jgi:hypothetical protein
MEKFIVIVRREEPISGIAIQPEWYLVMTEEEYNKFQQELPGDYYVDEIVPIESNLKFWQ